MLVYDGAVSKLDQPGPPFLQVRVKFILEHGPSCRVLVC